jgi:3'(2'), 5'-bisphosphate nucleotidase
MGENNYAKELDVAVRVVHMACSLCRRVQEGLVSSTSNDHVKSKDDDSLVTVAGNSIFLIFRLFFF